MSTYFHACQYGKQSRLPFPTTTWKAKKKFHLIHTNVGGPHGTLSLKGNHYYIIYVDDLTRMFRIYFLKFKSEVGSIF